MSSIDPNIPRSTALIQAELANEISEKSADMTALQTGNSNNYPNIYEYSLFNAEPATPKDIQQLISDSNPNTKTVSEGATNDPINTPNASSISDLASELMIIMLQNAQENKSLERMMKTELSNAQFTNGMKIADKITERGKSEFSLAITGAVMGLTAQAVGFASQKIATKVLTNKAMKSNMITQQSSDTSSVSTQPQKPLTDAQRLAINSSSSFMKDVTSSVVNCASTLASASLKLGISQIDAERQVLETSNKLVDSWISSVDSSIKSQEAAMQFAMNMVQQINNLAKEGAEKIINNMR